MLLGCFLIFETGVSHQNSNFIEGISTEGCRKGVNMGSNPKSRTLTQYPKFDFRRGGMKQLFLIYGLLRLQNVKVGLIPAKKFEFLCDTPVSAQNHTSSHSSVWIGLIILLISVDFLLTFRRDAQFNWSTQDPSSNCGPC